MENQFQIIVTFDEDAWGSMSPEDRQAWIEELQDSISEHAYINQFNKV